MSKDREESVKNKTQTKKRHSPNKSFESFLKKQNDVVTSLKAELQDCITEKQQIKCAVIEKNKCIQELQIRIEDRDNDIQKLNNDLSVAKDENVQTLHDFYVFKEKFYDLEAHYDKACQTQNREIDNLKRQLDVQKTAENQLKELSSSYQDLKNQLHERNQAFARINLDCSELLEKCEKNQQDFARQQKDFENYRKQVVFDKNAYDEKINQDFASVNKKLYLKEEQFGQEIAKLKEELSEKDEIIRQCIKDKQTVEEEKNRHIKELNYKISQIEKVFGQPTKTVAPLTVTPSTPQTSFKDQNATQGSANVVVTNVAVTKPQIRRESQDTNTDNNSENQQPEVSMRSRSRKITRPNQNNSLNSNVSKSNAANRKRGFSSLRNPSPPSMDPEFSTPSSDDDDDFEYPLWRPNNKPDHYVAETETDASESFSKTKRSKK